MIVMSNAIEKYCDLVGILVAGRPHNFHLGCELFQPEYSRRICFLRGSGGDGGGIYLPKFRDLSLLTGCRSFASLVPANVRNQSFSVINSDDISYFKKILGEGGVIQEEEKLDDANTDWMRKYKGSSKLMLQPRSTEEVYIFLSIIHYSTAHALCHGLHFSRTEVFLLVIFYYKDS